MLFHLELLGLLHELGEGFGAGAVSPEDAGGLDRFARLAPLYRQFLLTRPQDLPWLLKESLPEEQVRDQDTFEEWRAFRGELRPDADEYLPTLRIFRRRMSMRIAWRDVNGLHSPRESVRQISLLAELCVRECYMVARSVWESRMGRPWDEESGADARFCVLGLGKLGGGELNFSSDIDLIYFYDGIGQCRKEGAPTAYSNAQFFTKVAETFTASLQEQTEHGFLFRVDLRLRPEGIKSALVRSFVGMENYYAAAGQSWERLALIKARPIAGDIALGWELLESLHSFRYPRHPPPSLLADVAAMKIRTEKEVVGAENLRRDVKSGYGGIREIEFIVQAMQLLHAGRFPFLQTVSTAEGLVQLARYDLMTVSDSRFLEEAYWFLRSVEHRLQIRDEQSIHALPANQEGLDLLAESLGFEDCAALESRLGGIREGVRRRYDNLFHTTQQDDELDEWWAYFSGEKPSASLGERLCRWFGTSENLRVSLSDFVQGDRNFRIAREQVSRFATMAQRFDQQMPRLAFPLETIGRVSRFAEFYGSRSQFLSTCALDPAFFEVLTLLFDQSEFIFQLLCQRPEILDEVIRPEILRRRKTVDETVRELKEGAPDDGFEDWLGLYVKAEQVRIAIGDLLGYLDQEETEANLTALADAVMTFLMNRLDPGGSLLVVALGKYGGGEMSFGSDLDLLFLSAGADPEREDGVVRRVVKCLTHRAPLGSIYDIDLRLRPHGDAGPFVPNLAAMRKYHEKPAGNWERQVMARSRPVVGNSDLRREFSSFLDDLIYSVGFTVEQLQELWDMRLRIQSERDRTDPPELAFKTGPGGLVEIEFFAQFIQLRYGDKHPRLREPNTRRLLRAIGDLKLMNRDENEALLRNLGFLRRIEGLLRRNVNAALSTISESTGIQFAVARWSGFKTRDLFWTEHCRRMAESREIVRSSLSNELGIKIEGTRSSTSEKNK